jgi:hypothetical protein
LNHVIIRPCMSLTLCLPPLNQWWSRRLPRSRGRPPRLWRFCP